MKSTSTTGTTETERLFSTKANAAHLAQSIAQHQAGKATRRTLADLIEMQGADPLAIDQAWDTMQPAGQEVDPLAD